jgi:hypothetical protein
MALSMGASPTNTSSYRASRITMIGTSTTIGTTNHGLNDMAVSITPSNHETNTAAIKRAAASAIS